MKTINSIKPEMRKTKRSTLPTITYYSKPSGTCWLQASLHFLYRHFYDEIMQFDDSNKTNNAIEKYAETVISDNIEPLLGAIKYNTNEMQKLYSLQMNLTQSFAFYKNMQDMMINNGGKFIEGEKQQKLTKDQITAKLNNIQAEWINTMQALNGKKSRLQELQAQVNTQKSSKDKKIIATKKLMLSIKRYFSQSTPENLFSIAESMSTFLAEHEHSNEILKGNGFNPSTFLEYMKRILSNGTKIDILSHLNMIEPTTENYKSIIEDAVKNNKDIFFYQYLEGKTAMNIVSYKLGLKENTSPDTEHVIFCENLGNGQFKLHDNIHPEQTKIVDEAFFENEFQRLRYAKNHHEELNDYRKKKIKYKIRNMVENVLSGKGDNAMFFEQKPHSNKSEEKTYKTMHGDIFSYITEQEKTKKLMKKKNNNDTLNINLKSNSDKAYNLKNGK